VRAGEFGAGSSIGICAAYGSIVPGHALPVYRSIICSFDTIAGHSGHTMQHHLINRSIVTIGSLLALCALGTVLLVKGPSDASAAPPPAPCILGDGYKIPSGGSFVAYPTRCPNNCWDYPNGGHDVTLFCKNGVLGRSDPTLTADGTVAPYEVAAQYNGYSRCTALPSNPGMTPKWGQTPDRKFCVKL